MNGQFISSADARVEVLAHCLHYGTGVFEGIRCYETGSGPAVFRHQEHMARLVKSAALCRMELPFSADALCAAAREVIVRNNLHACYVRPIALRGRSQTPDILSLDVHDVAIDVAIAAWAWPDSLNGDTNRVGISACVATYRKPSAASCIPQAKASGHYLGSVLAKMEATAAGYDDAIMLDEYGYVAEGTGANIFIARDNRLITPALSGPILAGLTRDTVLRLAAAANLETVERPIARGELYLADEVFLTGTAVELMPVCAIDRQTIGTGAPGPITRRFSAAVDAVVHGRDPRHEHWLDPV